ncbi:MAG: rRNA maturation RNase YbeY [Bacteroidales bacterium]|nr:rRNA maturation RNase YbeY [Bacteroidales bacterium]MBQ9255385.1 rRNA maturation RNase YbeY [Bacteroidales bacterium]
MATSFTSQTTFNLKNKMKVKTWIKSVIEKENFKQGEISYIFCSDEKILEINKQYLNHDFYTDIITFDYTENNKINGDIFISIDRVKDNSKKFECSFEEELLRVIIHGVLHLMGYKDHEEKEEKLMRQKENEAICLYRKMFPQN